MKQVQEEPKSYAAINNSDLIKEHPKEMSAGQHTESRAFFSNVT